MTVGEYLKSLVWGIDIPDTVIERSAYSPSEIGLDKLEVDDDAYPDDPTEDNFQKRLDYASSTVYYAILGVFSGGGSSEQVGDVRVSKGSITVTQADRERFKLLADNLRKKWNIPVQDEGNTGTMFNAAYLKKQC